MQKTVFLFALLITLQASAGEAVRCGADAFGNEICMDKNGVVSPAPVRKTNLSDAAAMKKGNASGLSAASGVKPDNEDPTAHMRCGIDPFGNKVCQ